MVLALVISGAVSIALGLPLLLFRRVAWRAAMLLPTAEVLVCGLAILSVGQMLTWSLAALGLGLTASFYASMLFLWHYIQPIPEQRRWRW